MKKLNCGIALLGASLVFSPGASTATAQTGPAGEERIAGGARSGYDVSGLASGFGVVVWGETRSAPKGRREYRVASLSGDKVRRTAWAKGSEPRLTVRRQVDQRTGRAVVRVLQWCWLDAADRVCHVRTPRTLERSKTVFAAVPAPGAPRAEETAVDGSTKVVSTTHYAAVPDAGVAPTFRGASCAFEVVGGTTLPGLTDCARTSLQLDDGLVLARWGVASTSSVDGFVSNDRLGALDLENTAAGWQDLGGRTAGGGTSSGVQSACLLDDGVAVVRGVLDAHRDSDPASWSVAVRPLRAGGPSWSAPAPQLADRMAAPAFRFGCAGRSVYALIQRVGSDLDVASSRVVRLVPPS